jgi:O-antigen/teichoic acid export membrane protein
MIRAASLGGVLSAVSAWATSVFQGRQNFRRMGLLSAAQVILPTLGVWLALLLGHGLFAATAWFVGIQLALAGLSTLGVWSVLRGGGEKSRGPKWSEFRDYSLSFWPVAFAQFLSGQGDRAFVAGLRSLSEFTLYAVPLGLLQRLQMLPAAAAAALLPFVGELPHEHGDELRRLYLRSSRVLIATLAPAYALFFALMPQFLSLWLGGRFGDTSVWPARLMTMTQALGVVAFVPTTIAAGRRGGRWPATATWAQAAACCVLWWALIPVWGLMGAAAGSLAAQALATAIIAGYVHYRVVHLSAETWAAETLGPAFAGALALFAVVWPLRTHVTGWPGFAALCVLGCAVYTVVAWRLLPVEDREYLKRHAPAWN